MAVICAFASACRGQPAWESLTPEGGSVRESDGSGVETCQLVGTFAAGDMSRWMGHPAFHNHLRNQAATRGANVIVWDAVSPQAPTDTASGPQYRGQVVGKAYRCP
jgi:hypothetical protein